MVKYESIKITVPANQEAYDTIVSVPAGKKITLKALGRTGVTNLVSWLSIEGNRIIEVPSDFGMNQGNFVPLSQEVEGPQDIVVGGTDYSGSDHDVWFTLVYEE